MGMGTDRGNICRGDRWTRKGIPPAPAFVGAMVGVYLPLGHARRLLAVPFLHVRRRNQTHRRTENFNPVSGSRSSRRYSHAAHMDDVRTHERHRTSYALESDDCLLPADVRHDCAEEGEAQTATNPLLNRLRWPSLKLLWSHLPHRYSPATNLVCRFDYGIDQSPRGFLLQPWANEYLLKRHHACIRISHVYW